MSALQVRFDREIEDNPMEGVPVRVMPSF